MLEIRETPNQRRVGQRVGLYGDRDGGTGKTKHIPSALVEPAQSEIRSIMGSCTSNFHRPCALIIVEVMQRYAREKALHQPVIR